jgi:hypothetical protein
MKLKLMRLSIVIGLPILLVGLSGCGGGTTGTLRDRCTGTMIENYEALIGPGNFQLDAWAANAEDVSNLDGTGDGGETWFRGYLTLTVTPFSTDADGNEVGGDVVGHHVANSYPEGTYVAGYEPEATLFGLDCSDPNMGPYANNENFVDCLVLCAPGATEVCTGSEVFAYLGVCSKDPTEMNACAGVNPNFNDQRAIIQTDPPEFLAPTIELPPAA